MSDIIYEDGMTWKDGRTILYEVAPLTRDFQILESAPLTESDGSGLYKLKGLFHLAETQNANGRVYPKSLLEREIRNIMPLVKSKSVYGALDHPTDPTMRLGADNCCIITDLEMKGNKVLGELTILNTAKGRDLKACLEAGGRVGISSRGLGSLNENDKGVKIVQEDYQLITWDVVPNPSTPDAWLSENKVAEAKISKSYKILEEEIKESSYCLSEATLRNRINDLFGG